MSKVPYRLNMTEQIGPTNLEFENEGAVAGAPEHGDHPRGDI